MKKHVLLIAISLFATSLYAQNQEVRQVGDFNYVSMGISGDLVIRQGTKNEVILQGDEETLDNIETYVSGDKLKIRSESSSWFKNIDKIKVYITIKDFKGISVSGSGDVKSEGTLKGTTVDLGVSGSGDMDIALQATDIDCSISGSGSISLKGKGKTGSLTISGSGRMDATDYEVESINVRISGSGGAYVYATKEIDSRISGSGTIHYKGDPDKLSNHSSGSGRLKKM